MGLLLELNRISKSFSGKTIFYNISSSFTKGCYAILGSNGTGKTVLMEMLAGVLQQDSGSINLKDVGNSLSSRYKKTLTYIPGVPSFFPQTTGCDFLGFIYSIKNDNGDAAPAHGLIDELKLSSHLKTRFIDMSLGTQKKLFLVTLAMNNSKLIIMDEPSNALDDDSKLVLFRLITQLSENAIVVMTTHDQDLLNNTNPTIIKLISSPIVQLSHSKYGDQYAENILSGSK